METRKFKDLTIRDAFMFAAVMSDPEICRRVLELALGIPISEVHIQTEKTMAYHSEYHGFVWMFMLQMLTEHVSMWRCRLLCRNFFRKEAVIIMTR